LPEMRKLPQRYNVGLLTESPPGSNERCNQRDSICSGNLEITSLRVQCAKILLLLTAIANTTTDLSRTAVALHPQTARSLKSI
jgi:hypothetical protein